MRTKKIMQHKQSISMIQVHKDPLLSIYETNDGFIVIAVWSEACGNLLDPQNNLALDRMNRILFDRNPEKVLVDVGQCQFFLDPDNLDWKGNFMCDMLEYENASRVAFVVPLNLFVYPAFEATRISLEQHRKRIKYFGDHDHALAWLYET